MDTFLQETRQNSKITKIGTLVPIVTRVLPVSAIGSGYCVITIKPCIFGLVEIVELVGPIDIRIGQDSWIVRFD